MPFMHVRFLLDTSTYFGIMPCFMLSTSDCIILSLVTHLPRASSYLSWHCFRSSSSLPSSKKLIELLITSQSIPPNDFSFDPPFSRPNMMSLDFISIVVHLDFDWIISSLVSVWGHRSRWHDVTLLSRLVNSTAESLRTYCLPNQPAFT
jgi:hypothetical protein